MAKFLKHVGKHGDRKVAVIFRQIPDESHMCLVVYTETLNQNVHDPLMTTIESDMGQSSDNLGDALNRAYTKDGKIILQMLHREGMLKKVQTSQIVMTPIPNQTVRLSELNDMLNEMAKGEEAVKKLAEIDASRGLQDPKDVARRMRESTNATPQPVTSSVLDNSVLANNLRVQAEKMAQEAKGLLAESERLLKEAATLMPPAPEVKAPKVRKTTKKQAEKQTEAKVVAEKPATKRTTRVKKADLIG